MGAKSKSPHKKKNISKHVLKAREDQTKTTTEAGAIKDDNGKDTPEVAAKRKQRKNRRVKDPSEAATYLEEWKASKTSGKSDWKFNKNTQSWLIRHMYEADKIPKGVFALLQEYLSSLEGNTTKTWIRAEASRRALRYKSYEKETKSYEKETKKASVESTDTEKEGAAKDEDKKPAKGKTQTEDEQEEEERWNKLNDHDKRKEYKRARKVLETVPE